MFCAVGKNYKIGRKTRRKSFAFFAKNVKKHLINGNCTNKMYLHNSSTKEERRAHIVKGDRIMNKQTCSKQILAAVLVVAMLLCFAACAKTDNQSEQTETETSSVEFTFTRANFPRLNGSTAMVPLGQAIASVMLGETREEVQDLMNFSRTTQSYRTRCWITGSRTSLPEKPTFPARTTTMSMIRCLMPTETWWPSDGIRLTHCPSYVPDCTPRWRTPTFVTALSRTARSNSAALFNPTVTDKKTPCSDEQGVFAL